MVVRVLRVWRLVRPGRSVLGVRLVGVGRGVRLEVRAGRGRVSVACARYVGGGWVVRTPLGRRTVRAVASRWMMWAVASRWMVLELCSVLPGRLVRLSPPGPGSGSGSSGPGSSGSGGVRSGAVA
jgi:hypothetical protein